MGSPRIEAARRRHPEAAHPLYRQNAFRPGAFICSGPILFPSGVRKRVTKRLVLAVEVGADSQFHSPATAHHAIVPRCGAPEPPRPELNAVNPRMSGYRPAKGLDPDSSIR